MVPHLSFQVCPWASIPGIQDMSAPLANGGAAWAGGVACGLVTAKVRAMSTVSMTASVARCRGWRVVVTARVVACMVFLSVENADRL